MTLNYDPPAKPTPAERIRQERELMAIPRNLANKQKARPIKSSLPPSYAAIFDQCVEYAYRKVIPDPESHRLINRKTEYAFVQRAVKEYMSAIVLDARQNGVFIGVNGETSNNTAP
jgi:hypothetical protein